jgi:hypothetical protein
LTAGPELENGLAPEPPERLALSFVGLGIAKPDKNERIGIQLAQDTSRRAGESTLISSLVVSSFFAL